MFEIVSNPFAEMAQGVIWNGLGYVAKKKENSKDWFWLWWTLGVGLTGLAFFLFDRKEKKRRLEEEQKS
jgi:hypothetical protein